MIDVLDYLRDMRSEIREDSQRLERKVDTIVEKVDDHAVRIVRVEGTRKAALWLGAALLLGAITAGYDLLVNHLESPKLTVQQGGKP